ncbi:MAG: glycosyltransferase family 4 protein [Candidatus Shapirobacteria bacterium]
MMQRKILIVTPGFFPLFGGMEQECYLLAKEYLRNGVSVDILTEQTEKSFLKQENIEGINVYRIKHVDNRGLFGYLTIAIELIIFLLKNSHKYDFCVIRTLTFHGLVIGWLKVIGIIKIPTIITAETGGEHDDVIAIKTRLFCGTIVSIFNRHDYLNSICLENYLHYVELGFDKDKLTRIYNGVDVVEYGMAKYPDKVNSFSFIGRLRKTKGICELLSAFKMLNREYPKTRLNIGGDGEEKKWLVEYISNNGLEKSVNYWGYISNSDKEKFIMSSECQVLPSYSEGFPTTVLEATVYKRFNICTDVSDLRELYGDNIQFVKMRDVEDLYDKMKRLVVNSDKYKPNYDGVIDVIDIRLVAIRIWRLFVPVDLARVLNQSV